MKYQMHVWRKFKGEQHWQRVQRALEIQENGTVSLVKGSLYTYRTCAMTLPRKRWNTADIRRLGHAFFLHESPKEPILWRMRYQGKWIESLDQSRLKKALPVFMPVWLVAEQQVGTIAASWGYRWGEKEYLDMYVFLQDGRLLYKQVRKLSVFPKEYPPAAGTGGIHVCKRTVLITEAIAKRVEQAEINFQESI